MKTLTRMCAAAVLLLTFVAPATADILMTFEEFLGFDGAPISTFYTGVSFQAASSGQQWKASDIVNGSYNASSWPSGSGGGEYWIYGNVAAWAGVEGDNGKITFDNGDAKFVEIGFSVGYSPLTMWAYDAGGNLLDSDSGQPNLRYINGNPNGPGTLHVDWDGTNYISYVIIGDTGNFWVVDNVLTDATGIVVPVPGAVLLGILGLGTAVAKLRKRG